MSLSKHVECNEVKNLLNQQIKNRHFDFIHRNITLFIEKRKLQLFVVVKKIGKSGGVFSLVNKKGKEVHRFILTKTKIFTGRNEWIEQELPVTILPDSISTKEDVLGIKFHIVDRMEHIENAIR